MIGTAAGVFGNGRSRAWLCAALLAVIAWLAILPVAMARALRTRLGGSLDGQLTRTCAAREHRTNVHQHPRTGVLEHAGSHVERLGGSRLRQHTRLHAGREEAHSAPASQTSGSPESSSPAAAETTTAPAGSSSSPAAGSEASSSPESTSASEQPSSSSPGTGRWQRGIGVPAAGAGKRRCGLGSPLRRWRRRLGGSEPAATLPETPSGGAETGQGSAEFSQAQRLAAEQSASEASLLGTDRGDRGRTALRRRQNSPRRPNSPRKPNSPRPNSPPPNR